MLGTPVTRLCWGAGNLFYVGNSGHYIREPVTCLCWDPRICSCRYEGKSAVDWECSSRPWLIIHSELFARKRLALLLLLLPLLLFCFLTKDVRTMIYGKEKAKRKVNLSILPNHGRAGRGANSNLTRQAKTVSGHVAQIYLSC